MILDLISRQLNVDVNYLTTLIRFASYRYKTYTIPKRRGGTRLISHPSPELKAVQRWVARNIVASVPIHSSVFSYRSGVGIADIARIHAHNKFLLRVDFKDFFPSLRDRDVVRTIGRGRDAIPVALSDEDLQIIGKIVCRHGALTIGAPSSPSLSNAILFEFDEFAQGVCDEREVVYSRYADDLYLSTNVPNVLRNVFQLLREDLDARQSPSLLINDSKTTYTSKKRRRVVTGIILTPEGRLSVGRTKKREIRTLIHKYRNGLLPEEEISYLKGYLSFVKSVEPTLIDSLIRKFGQNMISEILDRPLVPRK